MRWTIFSILIFNLSFSQGKWYNGNLKGIDEINLEVNLQGSDETAWQGRITQFIQLALLDQKLKTTFANPMPKLVVDIHIIDSSVEPVSSFLINYSVYNYAISESIYYKSLADTLIAKKLLTHRIYNQEILGQSSSGSLYPDIEKSVKKLTSTFIDQWYRDNPSNQF